MTSTQPFSRSEITSTAFSSISARPTGASRSFWCSNVRDDDVLKALRVAPPLDEWSKKVLAQDTMTTAGSELGTYWQAPAAMAAKPEAQAAALAACGLPDLAQRLVSVRTSEPAIDLVILLRDALAMLCEQVKQTHCYNEQLEQQCTSYDAHIKQVLKSRFKEGAAEAERLPNDNASQEPLRQPTSSRDEAPGPVHTELQGSTPPASGVVAHERSFHKAIPFSEPKVSIRQVADEAAGELDRSTVPTPHASKLAQKVSFYAPSTDGSKDSVASSASSRASSSHSSSSLHSEVFQQTNSLEVRNNLREFERIHNPSSTLETIEPAPVTPTSSFFQPREDSPPQVLGDKMRAQLADDGEAGGISGQGWRNKRARPTQLADDGDSPSQRSSLLSEAGEASPNTGRARLPPGLVYDGSSPRRLTLFAPKPKRKPTA